MFISENNIVKKWMFKTNETTETGNIYNSILYSRKTKLDSLINDFMKNPVLGVGFQVQENHKRMYELGLISFFSAPTEKGFLPLIVLSECGVIGTIFFIFFIFEFYSKCYKKKYIATICLFSLLLITNLGEGTFFSPTGVGGMMWIICLLGGFVIDLKNNANLITYNK